VVFELETENGQIVAFAKSDRPLPDDDDFDWTRHWRPRIVQTYTYEPRLPPQLVTGKASVAPITRRFASYVFALTQAFPLPSVVGRGSMIQRVSTAAFEGIEARAVDVQVQVAPGLPAFAIAFRQ
jgi:hypothetical protein